MKLLKNIRLLENEQLVEKEILFDEQQILRIADVIDEPHAEVIDGKGHTLLPGLIDVHVHLREPGNEYKETIDTGTMAAAAGGFTTIMAMPNVIPYPDNVETMKAYLEKIEADAHVHVIPYATITVREEGKEVVDMAALAAMGIHAFSDDGVGVQQEDVMRQAMRKSHELGTMIVAHTEDMRYRKPDACVHAGDEAHDRHWVGIPSECEWKQLERDLHLVEETGAHYHCCHVSAKESVELLARYRQKGCDVSGEVTAHHLLLNDRDVVGPNWKMNPPLRSKADNAALIEAVADGTIDVIATDHAPHLLSEKEGGALKAMSGMPMIQFSLASMLELVDKGIFSIEKIVEKMSHAPAQMYEINNRGFIHKGYQADLVLVRPNSKWTVTTDCIVSKCQWSPLEGHTFNWKVEKTFVNGHLLYDNGKIDETYRGQELRFR